MSFGRRLPSFLDELDTIEFDKIAKASGKPKDDPISEYELRKDGKGGLIIEKFWVHPACRGKGIAGRMLEQIKRDHPGTTLRLRARPFGDMPMTIEQLRKFYEKHGFKVVDNKDNMIYIPEKKK